MSSIALAMHHDSCGLCTYWLKKRSLEYGIICLIHLILDWVCVCLCVCDVNKITIFLDM